MTRRCRSWNPHVLLFPPHLLERLESPSKVCDLTLQGSCPHHTLLSWVGSFVFLQQFWVCSRIEGKVPRPPMDPCPATACPLPTFLPGCTPVTISERTLTHPHCLESAAFTKVLLGDVHSMGVDRCIMTGSHHGSATPSSFTAPKVPCAPPVPTSSPPHLGQPLIFYGLHSSAFSRRSCMWNHVV